MENKGEIVIYQTKNGKISLGVKLEQDTVWLTQMQLAKLFDTTKPNISMHIKTIYKTKELYKMATVKNFLTVQNEGGRDITRNIEYYNLDIIISLGYRVNTKEGIRFRQWATHVLKDHIVKGFTKNPDRLSSIENSIMYLKDTIAITSRNVSRLLINTPNRDYVNAVDDKIDKLKEDFESIVKELKLKNLIK